MPPVGSQSSYEALIRRHAVKLEKAISKLEGDTSKRAVDRFAREFIKIIDSAHEGAVAEGRARAGDPGPLDDLDRELARELADHHVQFAEAFLDDIDQGRYGEKGALSGDGIRNRAYMYLDTVRGTANESFVVNSDPDEEWFWDLGKAEHCADCIFMHDHSPLSADELWTHPGAAETDCKARCKCDLRRGSDGMRGFAAINSRQLAVDATGKNPGNPGAPGDQIAASA